jgi:hypothetical protein
MEAMEALAEAMAEAMAEATVSVLTVREIEKRFQ